ncbi:MAG: tetratricopeptide repeat protein [Acidobacteriota bacterium]
MSGLYGPWTVVDELGRGGMGVVYRARRETDGVECALKTIEALDPGILASIRREIRALDRLRHPDIVRVLDHGVADGRPWYAMELLEGASLRSLTLDQGRSQATVLFDRDASPAAPPGAVPASLGVAIETIHSLCAPLSYLHGEGIVHRDLKPENVLIRPDGRPVLVDFGLMVELPIEMSRDTLAMTSDHAGTAWYCAPEQWRGETVDARADLYAMGCVLYELLTGRPPFLGPTVGEIMWHHLNSSPTPPSELLPGIPPALDGIVARLLAKDPRKRIGYCDVLAADLERLGATIDDRAPPGRPYLYRPQFAGRAALMRELSEYLLAAQRGRGSLLCAGGESGVGKTRMAIELSAAATVSSMTVIHGDNVAAIPARGSVASPLSSFAGLFRFVEDRCRLGGRAEVARILGDKGPLLARYHPTLAAVAGVMDHPAPEELSPDAARHRLHAVLSDVLQAVARDRPCLLILDDLQWADETSIELLRFLASSGRIGRVPLVILALFRAEEATREIASLADAATASFPLGRLDQEDVDRIACDMLAMESFPPEMSRFLSAETEGNPLFVAEYLRGAVAERLVTRDTAGVWRLATGGGGGLRLPSTLQQLLGARVAALDPAARDLLGAAAVLGRELDESVLFRVAGGDGATDVSFADAFRDLFAARLLEDAGGGACRFSHDKIREVVYGGVEDDRRRQLHARAARVQMALPEEARRACLAAIAAHWEAAGDLVAARPFYRDAARQARDAIAFDEAERLYRRSLALAEPGAIETAEIRLELGDHVLRVRGRLAEARTELVRAIAEGEAAGHRELALRAETARIRIARTQGQLSEAFELAAAAAARCRALGLRHLEGRLVSEQASAAILLGLVEESESLNDRALAIHREVGDRMGEAQLWNNVAHVHHRAGRLAEAAVLYERALAFARSEGARSFEAILLGNLGAMKLQVGDHEEARALLEASVAVAVSVGARDLEAAVRTNLATLEREIGRDAQAEVLFRHALSIHEEIGNAGGIATVLSGLALIATDAGRYDDARAMQERVLQIVRKVGDRYKECVALNELAYNDEEEGRSIVARERYEASLAIARELGDLTHESNALLCLGGLCIEESDLASGRSLVERGLALAAQTGARYAMASGQLSLARAARISGDVGAARRHLDEARGVLQTHADGRELAAAEVEEGYLALLVGGDAGRHLALARDLAGPAGGSLGRAIASLAAAIAAR